MSGAKKKSTEPKGIEQLKEDIIVEAKKLAEQKTSSAYDLVRATKELLRAESLINS